METILLLTIIGLVTWSSVWLRRRIGDEWPPAPQSNLAAADSPASPPAEPNRTIPVEELEAPATPVQAVAPAVTVPAQATISLPLTTPVDEAAVSQAPVPAQLAVEPQKLATAPEPVASPTGPALRRSAWALGIGGGLLLLLAQLTGRVLDPGGRAPAFLLTVIGGVALLVGIQSFVRQALPGWVGRPLARLAAFLRVSPAQAILLLLAPGFAWLTRLAAGDGLLARQATVALLSWLLAIAFVIAGSAARRDSESQAAGASPRLDRWDVILSVVVFVIALALRAYQTTQFPDTYSGDEGSAGLYAVGLLTGKANNLFGLGWFSFPSL
jgi:hypothetical protein